MLNKQILLIHGPYHTSAQALHEKQNTEGGKIKKCGLQTGMFQEGGRKTRMRHAHDDVMPGKREDESMTRGRGEYTCSTHESFGLTDLELLVTWIPEQMRVGDTEATSASAPRCTTESEPEISASCMKKMRVGDTAVTRLSSPHETVGLSRCLGS